MDLVLCTYDITASFPKQEIYGLSSQMQRAAVSICSNIAEGSGRETRRDFRRFVIQARGSACELHTQILVAQRIGYLSTAEFERSEYLVLEVGKMLSGLTNFLRKQAEKGTIPAD